MDKSLLPNIYEFISQTYPFSQLNDLEKDATATKIEISYHAKDDCIENEDLAGAGLFMIRAGCVEERNKIDNPTPITPVLSFAHSSCARRVCSIMSRTAPRPPQNSDT